VEPFAAPRADDHHESVWHHLLLAGGFACVARGGGLLALTLVLAFALRGAVKTEHVARIEVLALYWHFVDAVWVVVFTVVYIIGR